MTSMASWRRVRSVDGAVAIAERDALGTSARVVVWPPAGIDEACTATDAVLAALDQQASRFRVDSELSWLHSRGGGVFLISSGLAEAIEVALEAARWTGGRTDPTIGAALIALGYDRDFAAIRDGSSASPARPGATPLPAPGWRQVRLDGCLLKLPADIWLDLGATAKGVGADRAVRAALAATGRRGGVLVSLGGDIATGGTPPRGGWPVTAADLPDDTAGQVIRLAGGGAVATSSTGCRRWRNGGLEMHHIVDPRTGWPADGPWRTATVAAGTCADANAASTAAIVAGAEAEHWLAGTGLPARLTGQDGAVRLLNGWPAADGLPVPAAGTSRVYRGSR